MLISIAVIALFVIVMRQWNQISVLERELAQLRNWATSVKEQAATPVKAQKKTAVPAIAAKADVIAEPIAAKEALPADSPAAATIKPTAKSKAELAAKAEEVQAKATATARPDIETALGTRWAVWVGGLALALGGIFLVRYSIEAGIFGPGTRLALATVLGLALAGGGEFVRRTGFTVPLRGADNAYIPAILTAAGAFTLFGVVYAAHGIYGFIGPAAAFTLMGLIGIATIAAALVHGQALAGLGLLGSLATPLLVASQAPNPWALFGYLAIVLAATGVIARLRDWTFLMAAAFAGTGIWTILYIVDSNQADSSVILFINVVTLAVLGLAWLGRRPDQSSPAFDLPAAIAGVFVGLSAINLLIDGDFVRQLGPWLGTLLIVAMLGLALYRQRALALLFTAGVAVLLAYAAASIFLSPFSPGFAANEPHIIYFSYESLFWPGVALGLIFVAAGLWASHRFVAVSKWRPAAWAGWGVVVPLFVLAVLWLTFGNPDRDLGYAAAAVLLVAIFSLGGDWIGRAEQPALTGGSSVSFALGGAGVALLLAIHMAFGPGLTTVVLGAAAAIPALATRWRSYPVLGWLSVAAVIAVLGRVAFDPTIVGAEFLQRTPVFNWLLAGYGMPALAFGFSAWQLARTTAGRPRLAMEAAAALFAMLTVAMLVRHAMHGGVIDDSSVTLAEQAIYTLIAIGAGAILVAIDQRSPSSVLRIGSMAVGVISAALVAVQHFLTLNPLLSDESTGAIPVFNLLLLAYLLPGIAAGALALYARHKRPKWYAQMLALIGALLVFAYATLSVRRLFKGEFIGTWRGFDQLETYSYSALWLTMGVVLLVVGVKLQSQILRLASAALFVISVLKVFVLDMAELEGVLRALSFIGLGAVLIGIGLFYQRLLTQAARDNATPPAPDASAPPAAP